MENSKKEKYKTTGACNSKTMWKLTSTNQIAKGNQHAGILTNSQQLSFSNLEINKEHNTHGEERGSKNHMEAEARNREII